MINCLSWVQISVNYVHCRCLLPDCGLPFDFVYSVFGDTVFFPQWLSGFKSTSNEGATGDSCFSPWVGQIPWRRPWQPTPVFLPRESPWTQEPGGLQSMGPQKIGHNWSDLARTHTLCFMVYTICIFSHRQIYQYITLWFVFFKLLLFKKASYISKILRILLYSFILS